MTPRLLETVLREAAARAADQGGGSLSDDELLIRYAKDRDDASFTAMVARHGRVVWAVCRQSLPNEADAEDAFQATFLALARNAKSVRSSLPGWLHGVAVKVCAQARRTAGRLKVRESHAAVKEAEQPVPEAAWNGLLSEVHAEVAKLPAMLRDVFVLVDLQGVSQPNAAKALGWKPGTLTGRLCQARQMLIERLTSRGLAPVAALVGCGVGTVAVTAAVPATLFTATCAVGKISSTIPAAVSLLASSVTEGSWVMKSKLLAASIMIATATAITVVSAQDKKPDQAKPEARSNPFVGTPEPKDGQPPRGAVGRGGMGAGGEAGGRGMGGPPGSAGGPGMPPPGGMGMGGGASFGPARAEFEFKCIAVNANPFEMEKQLNELGKDHWDLVNVIAATDFQRTAIFKRVKPGTGSGFSGGGFGAMISGSGMMPGGMGGPGGSSGGPGASPGMPGMGTPGGSGFPGMPGGGGGGGFGGSAAPGGMPGGGGDGRAVPAGRGGDGRGGPGAIGRSSGGSGSGPRPGTSEEDRMFDLNNFKGVDLSKPGPIQSLDRNNSQGRGPGMGPGGAVTPEGGFGSIGGMMGGSPFGQGKKPEIISIDTPNLEPKKVAAALVQLFGARGIGAVEAPDGKGIVLTSTASKDDFEEVRHFISDFVNKARDTKEKEEALRRAQEDLQNREKARSKNP